MNKVVCLVVICALLSVVTANDVNRKRMVEAKMMREDTSFRSGSGASFIEFQQVLDHFADAVEENVVKFNQRYLVNSTLRKGKSYDPVFLIIGGEGPLSENAVSRGAVVEYAQQNSALLFALEHRFYGESSPFPELNASALSYLTTSQALADIAYFQTHVNSLYNLTDDNQWFVFGCSYSGALAAWYKLKYPHLVAAASSSSSPVEATLSFYQYDQAVSTALGQTCADKIREATTHIEDLVKANPNQTKDNFDCPREMENEGFLYTLADIIAFAVQYNSTYGLVPDLCHNFVTRDDIVQVYIEYAKKIFTTYDRCELWDLNHFTNETQDPSDNIRPWMWQSCNELGYFQTAPDTNPLRSKYITAGWHLRVCNNLFGENMNPTIGRTNEEYGAQKIQTTNTIFANGGNDPWRLLSVSQSRGFSVPAININGEAHCSNWAATKPTDSTYLKNGRKLVGSYLSAFVHPCAFNCHDHGVCATYQTDATSVDAKCLCYDGWEGDHCDSQIDEELRKVPWWSILIAGIGCLVVGLGFGWLIGAHRAKRSKYDTIQ